MRSGPIGPGFTGMRRGSSLTGVDGLKNFLRSCAFSCPATHAQEPSITISKATPLAFMVMCLFIFVFLSGAASYHNSELVVAKK